MNKVKLIELIKILAVLILVASFFGSAAFLAMKGEVQSLFSLLPEVNAWKHSGEPQNYIPENLFEYINGAAEIYLAYDFKELAVGQYQKENSPAALSVEIYDMGNEKNSFGIYSAERYPESRFIPIGNQGYLEEGTLNFIAGRYYIKLLCFDCGEGSDDVLRSFSQEIVTKIKDKVLLPPLLLSFPQEGLIRNSEKFILRNFLGYSFLHDGYVANYKLQGRDFDCFIIEGKSVEDAQSMLEQYLDKKSALDIKKISSGYVFKDRYYHNIYIARVKNYVCGVLKVQDDFREVGETYFGLLIENLKK
jgi:hypothetical protein